MKKKPIVYGFIFARGGSKGVPRKNLQSLGGMPLVAHSVQFGLEHPLIDRVIVSTDDMEIADVCRSHGAEVPFMRPPELATDTAPEHLAWQHAIRAVSNNENTPCFDIFVSLPATCPLRRPEDVTRAIERIQKGDVSTVVSVTEAQSHPQFNMVRLGTAGLVSRFMDGGVYRRQDAPTIYELSSVCFVSDPHFVLRSSSYFDGPVAAVNVPAEYAVDIDTMLDYKFTKFLFSIQGKSSND